MEKIVSVLYSEVPESGYGLVSKDWEFGCSSVRKCLHPSVQQSFTAFEQRSPDKLMLHEQNIQIRAQGKVVTPG